MTPDPREDPRRCAIAHASPWGTYEQCINERGHGPEGLLCLSHWLALAEWPRPLKEERST